MRDAQATHPWCVHARKRSPPPTSLIFPADPKPAPYQRRLSGSAHHACMNNTHTTTSTSATDNTPVRHHHKRNLLVASCALTVLAFTSCSAEQRRALGEQDVRDSLTSHVNQTVN